MTKKKLDLPLNKVDLIADNPGYVQVKCKVDMPEAEYNKLCNEIRGANPGRLIVINRKGSDF
jgi:hypothetical protein